MSQTLRTNPYNNSDPTTSVGMLVRSPEHVPDRSAFDPQPDGRRYAACGDGVVANVAEWIAGRLAAVIVAEADERQAA